MDVSSRNNRSFKFLVACGTGVMNDDALVAEVTRSPDSCVNAHVAHRTADDDLLDSVAIEHILEVRFTKCIDLVFYDDRLTVSSLHIRMDLCSFRSRCEK